jgi:rare lipoprotein A
VSATPPSARRGRRHLTGSLLMAAAALVAGCATTPPRDQVPSNAAAPVQSPDLAPDLELERGKASWYGPGFQGKRTASGERFDMNALTAAHRTLPFGSRIRVRNRQNGREVVVRINDRGPWAADRIIDVSKAAAAALGLLQAGEAPVVLIGP